MVRSNVASAVLVLPLVLACTSPGESSDVHALDPGSEQLVEGVLERGDPFWPAAPFLHETPLECPLAYSNALPSPHHAFVVRAEGGPIVLSATLERPDGGSASADMALGVYAGDALPSTAEAAADCLAIGAASGPFPGEALGVSVDDGATVTVALWSYAGALPQRYRLTLRAD